MRFKTTDLMVTVLPKAELDPELAKVCLLHTWVCKHPTFNCGCSFVPSCLGCSRLISCLGHTHCGACSVAFSCAGCSVAISACGQCSYLASIHCPGNSCGPGGSACDPTIFCAGGSRDPFVIEHLEDLVALRADLQDTLKQLDVLQKEGLKSAIASKADADAMEKSLTDALEQVRAARKTLK